MSIKPRNENPGGKVSSDIKKKSKDDRGSSNELRRERIKALEREIEELEETISRRSFFGR